MPDAEEIIEKLKLTAHPAEGGFYRESYRSKQSVPGEVLGTEFKSDKSACTAIYYLLTPRTFSRLHRLTTDEIYHFYLGDPVRMLLLLPDGSSQEIVLGHETGAREPHQ